MTLSPNVANFSGIRTVRVLRALRTISVLKGGICLDLSLITFTSLEKVKRGVGRWDFVATFRQCSINLSAVLNVCKIEKWFNSQTSVTQTKTTTKSSFSFSSLWYLLSCQLHGK